MFGKKKNLPDGARLMHYEGLPGHQQDAPCFMEQTDAALLFHRVDGPTVTLPLEKVNGLEIMPERDFAAKYRGTGLNTSRTNAVKWYAVITYDITKRLVFWSLGGKELDALRAIQRQVARDQGDITL